MTWTKRTLASFAAALLVPGAPISTVASPHAQEIRLVLREYSFMPKLITFHVGMPVKLILVNMGDRDHEFQVYSVPKTSPRDWNTYAMAYTYFRDMGEIDVALPGEAEIGTTTLFKVHVAPGASVTIWFTPQRKGMFQMASHNPGEFEREMRGLVVVK
jgi:uncharacterized cupredoxin-like copper-binding protein